MIQEKVLVLNKETKHEVTLLKTMFETLNRKYPNKFEITTNYKPVDVIHEQVTLKEDNKVSKEMKKTGIDLKKKSVTKSKKEIIKVKKTTKK